MDPPLEAEREGGWVGAGRFVSGEWRRSWGFADIARRFMRWILSASIMPERGEVREGEGGRG